LKLRSFVYFTLRVENPRRDDTHWKPSENSYRREKTTMVVGVSTNKTDVPRKTGTEGERAHMHESLSGDRIERKALRKKFKRK